MSFTLISPCFFTFYITWLLENSTTLMWLAFYFFYSIARDALSVYTSQLSEQNPTPNRSLSSPRQISVIE